MTCLKVSDKNSSKQVQIQYRWEKSNRYYTLILQGFNRWKIRVQTFASPYLFIDNSCLPFFHHSNIEESDAIKSSVTVFQSSLDSGNIGKTYPKQYTESQFLWLFCIPIKSVTDDSVLIKHRPFKDENFD